MQQEERVDADSGQQAATRAEDEEQQEEEEEETRIDVTIPYCRFSLGAELHFVKTPNFLSLESKPFDASLYEDEMEDEEILDEEGRARLKLKVCESIEVGSSDQIKPTSCMCCIHVNHIHQAPGKGIEHFTKHHPALEQYCIVWQPCWMMFNNAGRSWGMFSASWILVLKTCAQHCRLLSNCLGTILVQHR